MAPQTWTDYFVGLLPSFILIFLWLIPVLIACARLRKESIDETAKAVWALIILIVPVVGSITYLMLFTGRQKVNEN